MGIESTIKRRARSRPEGRDSGSPKKSASIHGLEFSKQYSMILYRSRA